MIHAIPPGTFRADLGQLIDRYLAADRDQAAVPIAGRLLDRMRERDQVRQRDLATRARAAPRAGAGGCTRLAVLDRRGGRWPLVLAVVDHRAGQWRWLGLSDACA